MIGRKGFIGKVTAWIVGLMGGRSAVAVPSYNRDVDGWMKTIVRIANDLPEPDRKELLDATVGGLWLAMASAENDAAYYKAKADGTWPEDTIAKPDGFYNAVVQSPQWKAWETEQALRVEFLEQPADVVGLIGNCAVWDVDESRETGRINQEHFQDFIRFCSLGA